MPFGAQKNSRFPGPNNLPLAQIMAMHASKTLSTGLYKSEVLRWFYLQKPTWEVSGPYCGGWGSRCIKELNRPARAAQVNKGTMRLWCIKYIRTRRNRQRWRQFYLYLLVWYGIKNKDALKLPTEYIDEVKPVEELSYFFLPQRTRTPFLPNILVALTEMSGNVNWQFQLSVTHAVWQSWQIFTD